MYLIGRESESPFKIRKCSSKALCSSAEIVKMISSTKEDDMTTPLTGALGTNVERERRSQWWAMLRKHVQGYKRNSDFVRQVSATT